MGSCCSSCIKAKREDKETELVEQLTTPKPITFAVSQRMSHPSIRTSGEDGFSITGEGLALIDVVMEQDSAYWEWHIDKVVEGEDDDEEDEEDLFGEEGALMFGLATRKSPEFYKIVEENEDNDGTSQDWVSIFHPGRKDSFMIVYFLF